MVEVPEESCDLTPAKTCHFQTKLVPRLKPVHECTLVPKEVCQLKSTPPVASTKLLLTKWCLDPTEPAPGDSYDEDNALADPLTAAQASYNSPVLAPVPNSFRPSSGGRNQNGGYRAPAAAGNGYGAPAAAGPEYASPPDNGFSNEIASGVSDG